MTTREAMRASGSSPAAIRRHYDLSDDFFGLWLGPEMVYSCALWDPADPQDTLAAAQHRKIDYFAGRLGVRGRRVLDVGCGWGGLLDRWVRVHGAHGGTGLTLSAAQAAAASARHSPGVDVHTQSWVDHDPAEPYDVITCIESTEHFASDGLDAEQKAEVYRSFFERAADWLRPDGRLGLQLICLDNVGHQGSRPGRGPLTDLILNEIFPEAMSPSLSELVLGWETYFSLDGFAVHTDHYQRTFRAWNLAYRAHEEAARVLVGPQTARTFERYFAAGEACFRMGEQALFRATLTRRPEPKVWAVPPRPVREDEDRPRVTGASPAAVQSHYDVSDDFYALWLGPTMMYSSGLWGEAEIGISGLDAAEHAKIDYFVRQVLPNGDDKRLLDVGCGWGQTLRRAIGRHGVTAGVGLTLSEAQRTYVERTATPGLQVRLQSWADHTPTDAYDAITSFGAFEHFAPDGSSSTERVDVYREFFGRCFGWLAPGGRMGLETIAHDQAPDTAHPLGRGPLGDTVLEVFPESICPQLCEVLLGFEPYFAIEALRSDAADFARTCRAWMLGLRAHREQAEALVGPETVLRFHRYLVASEAQFRTGVITNYRFVLHRRDRVRH